MNDLRRKIIGIPLLIIGIVLIAGGIILSIYAEMNIPCPPFPYPGVVAVGFTMMGLMSGVSGFIILRKWDLICEEKCEDCSCKNKE